MMLRLSPSCPPRISFGQIAGLISGFARDIAVCVNGVSLVSLCSIQQVSGAEGSLVAAATRGGNVAPLAHSRRV